MGKKRAVIHFSSVPVINLIGVVKLPVNLHVWYELCFTTAKVKCHFPLCMLQNHVRTPAVGVLNTDITCLMLSQ